MDIFISLAALVVSTISLYLSQKTSKESWERSTRLPYYDELNIFIERIINIFHQEVGVYKVPEFEKFKSKAKTLGLVTIWTKLDGIESFMKELDEDRHQSIRNIPLERDKVALVMEWCSETNDLICRDVQRLTQKR